MINQPPDDFSVGRAAASRGAVARVDAVSRTAQSAPVDPARGTDLRPLEFPRPDLAAVPIADVTHFQSLVYGSELPAAAEAPSGGQSVMVSASGGALTPADRIVDTLRHLRGLHGL